MLLAKKVNNKINFSRKIRGFIRSIARIDKKYQKKLKNNK